MWLHGLKSGLNSFGLVVLISGISNMSLRRLKPAGRVDSTNWPAEWLYCGLICSSESISQIDGRRAGSGRFECKERASRNSWRGAWDYSLYLRMRIN